MKNREVKRMLAGGALSLAVAMTMVPAGQVMAAPEGGDVDIEWSDDILGGGSDNGGDTGNGDGSVDGGNTDNGDGSDNGGDTDNGDGSDNGGDTGNGDGGDTDNGDGSDNGGDTDNGDGSDNGGDTDNGDGSVDGGDTDNGDGSDNGGDTDDDKNLGSGNGSVKNPEQTPNKVDPNAAPKTGDMATASTWMASGLVGLAGIAASLKRKFFR